MTRVNRAAARLTITAIGLLVFGAGILLAQQTSKRPPIPAGYANCPEPALRSNVEGEITCIIAALRAEGVTSENAKRLNVATRYSTPRLRVDDRARINVVLELTKTDDPSIQLLRTAGNADIKSIYRTRPSVLAWVPYDRIDALAPMILVPGQVEILKCGYLGCLDAQGEI